MKITILVDNLESWFMPYAEQLVSDLAKEHDVVLINNHKDLKKGNCAFFLSCIKKVPKEYLALNSHNIVIHPSDLPKGRGWSPLTWQILEGKNKIPMTLFEATEHVDEGDFYLKDVITFEGHELNDELKNAQGKKTIEMALKFISNYDKFSANKQNGEISYYSRRTKKDSRLDINKSIKSQFNNLRVADNERYPSFFEYMEFKYILKIDKKVNT